jgi:hypothetical protein
MPQSPHWLKGALIRVPARDSPRVFVFPFNPETLRRRLDAAAAGSALRAPRHRLGFDLVLDATDALVEGAAHASLDVLSQLAALESLVLPARRGEALLFAWGATRLLPIAVASLDVREELFDAELCPLRANVTVELDVFETARGLSGPWARLVRQRDAVRAALAERGFALSATALARLFR